MGPANSCLAYALKGKEGGTTITSGDHMLCSLNSYINPYYIIRYITTFNEFRLFPKQ